MNKLDRNARISVINFLIEGCSIRSTVRMTGVAKKTVMRLLVEAGAACSTYQDRIFRGLSCRRIQVDEMWAFIGAKQKNVTPEIAAKNPNAGDIWLWVAIDADSKLVPTWMLGGRDANAASQFLHDLRQRLANRVQLTSDGHKAYLQGVDFAFGGMNIDYAMLVKIYGESSEGQKRYSPAECIGCERRAIVGNPDPDFISTSFAERQNLSVRMTNRRYTRLIKRIQPEARKSYRLSRARLFRVQLHQDPPYIAMHARHGRWRFRSALGSIGLSGATRSRRIGV